jgi:putative toxin-antitoxin system antitoxin component (TIGR02293 family)
MTTQVKQRKLDINSILQAEDKSTAVLKFLYGNQWTEMALQNASGYDIIDTIRLGLPKAGVDAFLEKTSVDREKLSQVLHISTRQLNRYKPEQRLSPEQSNFLYEVTRIYTRALDILGDKATAEHWLAREQLALGNHTPLQLLDTTEGVRLVDDLLSQIEYGFYS